MAQKHEWIRLDAFLTFYFKPNRKPDVVYHDGSRKIVTKAEEMAEYDLAVTINISHITDPIYKLDKSEFTRREIAEQIGLSERLVKFYTDEGLIIPEIDPGHGRGDLAQRPPVDGGRQYSLHCSHVAGRWLPDRYHTGCGESGFVLLSISWFSTGRQWIADRSIRQHGHCWHCGPGRTSDLVWSFLQDGIPGSSDHC